MGGSAKQVRDKVAKETGYTGSDLDKAGQHVAKKGGEVVEGVKEHGGAIATGVGQGLGKLGTEAMSGLKHNLDQVANVVHGIMGTGPEGGGSSGTQSASANYSGSSKRSRSGAKKKGDLEAGERKGATGKQKLYARRKTA